MNIALVHYSEIALKGKNRSKFENKLIENIHIKLKNSIKKIRKIEGRIALELKNPKDKENVKKSLSKVFGIKNFSFAASCPSDIKKIKETITQFGPKLKNKTFKVHTKRSNKSFPYSSAQVNNIIGEFILKNFSKKVSLKNPQITIYLEITKKETFIYDEKFAGAGGLPVGTAPKVLVLLSGGIDSCVASLLLMKRGCSIDYLHIHALPQNEELANTKIKEIFYKLKEFGDSKLFALPYHKFDIEINAAPPKYGVIIFRRFIASLAEKLSEKIDAKAIATGDNLSQVASQTLQSIIASDEKVSIPVLRPLITFDKEEIINISKKFSFYELSIKPYKDCCSLILRHPHTSPDIKKLKAIEKKINLNKIINESFKEIKEVKL